MLVASVSEQPYLERKNSVPGLVSICHGSKFYNFKFKEANNKRKRAVESKREEREVAAVAASNFVWHIKRF